jgi:cysteine desulfurase
MKHHPPATSTILYASTYDKHRSFEWDLGLTLLTGAGTTVAAVAYYYFFHMKRQSREEARNLLLANDLSLTETSGSGTYNSKCIYLDYNGTTPIHPNVVQVMAPYFTNHFGNPSSSHFYGKAPAAAIQKARHQILQLLGRPQQDPTDSIWFTGSGTEANHMAIAVALKANRRKTSLPHIVTSNVEHPAIAKYLEYLEQEGKCHVTYVPVRTDGRVVTDDMIAAIDLDKTILVTLMTANNETGALQPVTEVAQYCRSHRVMFHTDAAQAAGKVSLDLTDSLGDADMVTIVGHKIGAPKGVACLYVRPGCLNEDDRRLSPGEAILFHGGGQEFGRRAGTPNVPYIAGLGQAAADAAVSWKQRAKHMAAVTEYLYESLQEQLGSSDYLKRHGPMAPHHRLPNTLSVGIRNVHSGELLAAVADQVAASAGAACHSSSDDAISSVLQAMYIAPTWARGTLRLSVGPSTTFDQVERAAAVLAHHAQRLWKEKKLESPMPTPEEEVPSEVEDVPVIVHEESTTEVEDVPILVVETDPNEI